jgi:predicted transposase/invertase (TIGR01784 family)
MPLPEKYINPFTDFGFKKLFGSELNKELLIDFLNQILPPHHHIEDLSYGNAEQFGIAESERKAIFDVYCTSDHGEKFIVEMQKAKQNYFKDRSVYYSTFPIQEQAQKGTWDFRLSAVYMVGILDFVFAEDKEDNEVRHVIQLKDERNRVFYDKLMYIYIELPKFTKTESELTTNTDKWLYALKRLPELDARPAALEERIFEKLFEAAEIARYSRQEREEYEQSVRVYRDLYNVMQTAMNTSFDEGVMQGVVQGKIQGSIEGEQRKAIEIARKALAKGLSPDEVVELTGLPLPEIQSLR